MITLHESNITSFPHDNGIGVLKDVIRAYAEEELNGLFEFYMEYDSEGHLVDELKEERIIKAKAQDKLGYQLFRIYSITKNHENDNLIVRAQHITYDLADNFVEKLEANNLTKKQVMELIGSSTVLPHPFNITSPNTTTRSSTKLYRTNPLQMVGGIEGSILQIWGGQIERDNFNLILHDRRGSDDGVKVTYEKNITGLEATFDISGLVTRIFPFVYIEETDNEPARLITVSGKYIDSPHINDYEKIYIRPIDYTHDERIDLNGTDAQIRQQLTEIASKYFEETGNDKIKVDMEVQFEHLWETEEYKDLAVLELVGMGDTVTIEHSRLKVNATAIVNYIRYDCIAEKNEEVRLGSVKARLTDNVNKVVDVAEKAERAEQTANQAIRTANGKNTIYYGPDEPMTGQLGDLWFRVVDGEYTRTYRHDGIQWQLVLSVDVRDAIDEAQQAKDEAQSAVDRANQATQQATDAINQAQKAFDEAQQALSTANNALTQATSAFSLANDAFSEVTALSTIVDENTGEISTIKQSVIGLQTQVSDNAGNISSLTQIAQGLQTQVTDIEGNVSTLQQTAQGLQSSITNLQNELDGLEIGGRNLLRNSDFSNGMIGYAVYTSTSFDGTVSFEDGVIKITSASTAFGGFYVHENYRPQTLKGQVYTVTIWAKGFGTMRIGQEGVDGGLATVTINSDDYMPYSHTFTPNITSTNAFSFYVNSPTDGIYVDRVKLEKGHKATDWTPAPEDIDHQFSVITQTIDSITTRVGDAEGNITALQQTSSSLAARLTDAEGNITTLTATVSGLQTTVTNVQGDVSSVTQLANALQVRMTDAEGNISTLTQTASSLQSTVSSLQDEWDNLEIGGRNLIKNSAFEKGDYNGWANIGLPPTRTVVDISDLPGFTKAFKITTNAANQGIQQTVPIVPNQEYILSWWAKDEGNLNDNHIQVFYTDLNTGNTLYLNTGAIRTLNWQRYTWNRKFNANAITIRIGRGGSGSNYGTTYFTGLKLELGNKATDWTPAPEDMATQSQITQLSDAINLRVMKGDVINQINISDESILIDGKRIHITGQTTIDDASIDGAKIKNASIGNAQIGYIDAAKIATGTLQSIDIYGVTIRGSTIWVDGDRPDFLYTNAIDTNPNTAGKHIYIRPTSDGEVRATVTNTINQYVPMRASQFKAAPLDHAYITTDEALRVMSHDRTTYRDVRANVFRGIALDLDGSSSSDNLYIRPGGPAGSEVRITARHTTDAYRNLAVSDIRARSIRHNSNLGGIHLYLGSNGEIRAVSNGTIANERWDDIGYRPIRAAEFIQASSRDYKTNIEKYTESALAVINDLTVVTYNLKDDLANGIIDKKVGFISEDSPAIATADGKAIQTYQLSAYNTKAIQELDMKFTNLEDKVNWLEIENQYLKQKIEQLEEMIA